MSASDLAGDWTLHGYRPCGRLGLQHIVIDAAGSSTFTARFVESNPCFSAGTVFLEAAIDPTGDVRALLFYDRYDLHMDAELDFRIAASDGGRIERITLPTIRVLPPGEEVASVYMAVGVYLQRRDATPECGRELNLDYFRCSCPSADIINAEGGRVIGTQIYNANSSICLAALHAGAIGSKGGEVLTILAGGFRDSERTSREGNCPYFDGSEGNGVRSESSDRGRAFFFDGDSGVCDEASPPPKNTWYCVRRQAIWSR